MKVAALLFTVVATTLATSPSPELSPDHRRAVEASAKFHPVSSTTDLPPPIVSIITGPGGKIAEPGGKWEATDAISDASLPAKRLIWAATDGEHYVVHYERGGIAHTHHILVAQIPPNDKNAEFVWTVRTQPLADYAAFVTALRANTLDADLRRAR